MQRIIEKAAVLIEAMPYFQRFQGETIVVKVGGSIMEDANGVANILRDIAFMAVVGMRPVVVHGGGKAISAKLRKAGIAGKFVKGLRVTDRETVAVVEEVLNHEVNPQLVQTISSFKTKSRGIYGDTILTATKHSETDPESGELLDWNFVGDVTQVDTEPVKAFLNSGITPVITPLGRDSEHQIYNINADSAAVAIAAALKARKLVFLSDVPGLLADPTDRSSLLSTVCISDVAGLTSRGVISGGMLPKINGCVEALQAGVQKIHIIDSNIQHSLLLELFTDQGVGTEIVHG